MPLVPHRTSITDPSGTTFEVYGRSAIDLNIKFTGYRMTGQPRPVHTTINMFSSMRRGYLARLEEALADLIQVAPEDLRNYNPGIPAYILHSYIDHHIGFDLRYKKFYYQYSNSYTRHRLVLLDPETTLTSFVQSLQETIEISDDISVALNLLVSGRPRTLDVS